MASDVQERIYRLVVDGGPALAALNKIAGSTSNIDNRFQKLGDSLRAAFGVFAAGGIAKSIYDNAQKLNSLAASLEVLRGSAESGGQMMERIFDIVEKTGVSLDVAGESVKKLSIGLSSLGASNAQINEIAENFIKLGRVGGSSAEAVSSAMLQFGQALSSGVLQGDEFKSISEQMPLLMQQLAKSLGVTTGELKKMGSAGKLTSDVVANALLEVEGLDEAFAKLPQTLDQGMNRINASLARMSQEFFNQTESGATLVTLLNIIADEIDKITEGSNDWKAITDDIGASFQQVAEFVVNSVREVKQFAAAVELVANGLKAVLNQDWGELDGIGQQFKDATTEANNAADAQIRRLRGTENELDLLAAGVDNFTSATGKLKPPPAIADTGKAAKAAANELKALESAWDSLFKKVQTPDELFAADSLKLDQIVAKLNPAADAVARVREELEKTRAKAAEGIRLENLSEFQRGFEDAAKSLVDFGKEAEQLKGKVNLLEQLRGVEQLNGIYLQLAESLGESASAADQVAVAVAKVNAEADKTAALKAEFEKLKDVAGMTPEKLEKVKAALGGLGDAVPKLDSIAVAIGQTLSGSVSSFVDTLMSSEGSINEWFANLIMQIGKLIIQMAILNQMKAMFPSFFAGAAKGTTVEHGTGLPQGIYNQPTFFKFAKGATFGRKMGVLGEAGPEAVVPLKRTGTGDLGVQASPVYVEVNNYTDSEVKVSETNREDGSKQLEIIIQKKLQASMSDGSLDRAMRDNYNVSRAGR